jgi:hypothetical protein
MQFRRQTVDFHYRLLKLCNAVKMASCDYDTWDSFSSLADCVKSG